MQPPPGLPPGLRARLPGCQSSSLSSSSSLSLSEMASKSLPSRKASSSCRDGRAGACWSEGEAGPGAQRGRGRGPQAPPPSQPHLEPLRALLARRLHALWLRRWWRRRRSHLELCRVSFGHRGRRSGVIPPQLLKRLAAALRPPLLHQRARKLRHLLRHVSRRDQEQQIRRGRLGMTSRLQHGNLLAHRQRLRRPAAAPSTPAAPRVGGTPPAWRTRAQSRCC